MWIFRTHPLLQSLLTERMKNVNKSIVVACCVVLSIGCLCGFSLQVPNECIEKDQRFVVMVPAPDVDPDFSIEQKQDHGAVQIIPIPKSENDEQSSRDSFVYVPIEPNCQDNFDLEYITVPVVRH